MPCTICKAQLWWKEAYFSAPLCWSCDPPKERTVFETLVEQSDGALWGPSMYTQQMLAQNYASLASSECRKVSMCWPDGGWEVIFPHVGPDGWPVGSREMVRFPKKFSGLLGAL